MVILSKKQNIFFIFALSAIMWVTRGHHLASLAHLPDASWAIFFVAGFYFSSFAVIALFLAQAFLIDYIVVTQLGIGQSCYTIAYSFVLPAYLSMWFGGRWLANRYTVNIVGFRNFLISALLGIVVCELISSGSYYFINVPVNASFTEFMGRIIQYLPYAVEITFAYLVTALVIHLLVFIVPEKLTISNETK